MTAVEWLMINLHKESNAFEKAKEMEIQQIIDFVEWLTREDSPYAITYGGEPERLSTLDEDFTIEEVYETYKKGGKP